VGQTIFTPLRYKDAHAAIDFLVEAFGFEKKAVHEGEEGTVAHAELTFDGEMIMLGSEATGDDARRLMVDTGPAWTYVVVDDPDAHFERSKGAGAEVVLEPTDQDYGGRDYTVRDHEGHLWTFGTYRPET
jgi:uncharacterized glyoxalase superfamily protein PhnB